MPHGMGTQDTTHKSYGGSYGGGKMKEDSYGGSGYQEGGFVNKQASTGIGMKPVMTSTKYKHDVYADKTTFHGYSKAGNGAERTQKRYGGTMQYGGDGINKGGGVPEFKKGYSR